MAEPVPYQALYRRFRPQRFDEVLGQGHVTTALRNAVREGRVGHGYLFSGPRGTGKTSTARILAKALNCERLEDGEPCGVCDSCVSVAAGNSFAVFEMDAASNRGIDAIRDLIQRIALGSPGQRKVYIIDEVHHLTNDAATALLKTLEEPPGHVVFVLATTDPQKVLPTIKSRVQHYDFHLMGGEVLQQLVAGVNTEAGLGLDDAALERVVKRGAGSARDALSVLDQAAALGSVDDEVPVADEVVEAMCERDPGRALEAIAAASASGRDARRMGDEILAHLRDVFLASRAPSLVDRSTTDTEHLAEQAQRLGVPALVRAMERLGEALVEMREALDARVSLEVAVVRVTSPEADTTVAALLERVDRLERRLAEGGPTPAAPASAPSPSSQASAPTARAAVPARARPEPAPGATSLPGGVTPPPPRPALGALRRSRDGAAGEPASTAASPAPGSAAPAVAGDGPSTGGTLPSREELTVAWGDAVVGMLRGRAKALYAVGRFVRVEGGEAHFALPNEAHRAQCTVCQGEVESALQRHFGRPVPLKLIVDGSSTGDASAADGGGAIGGGGRGSEFDESAEPFPDAPRRAQPAAGAPPAAAPGAAVDDEDVTAEDIREMREAAGSPDTPEDRVKLAFPGATEVERP